jgi:CheY-like chemotaxis protein
LLICLNYLTVSSRVSASIFKSIFCEMEDILFDTIYWVNKIDLTEIIYVQEINIDIILTDYFMPQMTGYDLLRAVKVG